MIKINKQELGLNACVAKSVLCLNCVLDIESEARTQDGFSLVWNRTSTQGEP